MMINKLVQQDQAKCNKLLQDSELFMNMYKKLVNVGLPSCWDNNLVISFHRKHTNKR